MSLVQPAWILPPRSCCHLLPWQGQQSRNPQLASPFGGEEGEKRDTSCQGALIPSAVQPARCPPAQAPVFRLALPQAVSRASCFHTILANRGMKGK